MEYSVLCAVLNEVGYSHGYCVSLCFTHNHSLLYCIYSVPMCYSYHTHSATTYLAFANLCVPKRTRLYPHPSHHFPVLSPSQARIPIHTRIPSGCTCTIVRHHRAWRM